MSDVSADEKPGPQYILRGEEKPILAYHYTGASEKGRHLPLVMFLGGYRSDMTGTKATYFEEQCKARGQAYLRFDYSGHGVSGGKFEEGSISQWAGDALAVLDHIGPAEVILVGSSMGGWIAFLVGLDRMGMVKGMVGIAAAPDFTEDIYSRLNEQQQKTLMQDGIVYVPNDYSDEPYSFTKKIYEDGKDCLILAGAHKLDFPVRLVQGMRDKDVPWQTAIKIQDCFKGADIDVVFVDDGDHRLSREQDLALIDKEIRVLSGLS